MKYCSLDPASVRNLGWSVVEAELIEGKITSMECKTGTFILPEVEKRWQVLGPISENISHLFEENKPDLVILEQTGAFSGGFITNQVSQCIGAILIICLQTNIPVEFTYPTHVKKVLTGKGKATKVQIRKGITTALDRFNITLKYDSEHASDALGNIISFLIDKTYLDPVAEVPVKIKKVKKEKKK